jgi:hypothetical protein
MSRTHKAFVFATLAALAGSAHADIAAPRPGPITPAPRPPHVSTGNRDAVALARRDPEIAKMIVHARGGQSDATGPATPNETAVQVPLAGQCGFAGCGTTTLVAFTFRSSGANTTTRSVLAVVTCPPVPSAPCTVAPAEVRASGGSAQR